MNFEKWYKSFFNRDYNIHEYQSPDLKIGWNACKKEVLKILDDYEFANNFEYKILKGKIEKL